MKHGGTIDKYMGDCIMAFWNAPLEIEEQEKKATEAALEMREALGELNEIFRNSISSGNTIVIFHSCRRLQQAWYRHSDDMRSRTRVEC